MNVLLQGVVGSVAYGLNTSTSDVDRLGVFAAPTRAFHGLHPPQPTQTTAGPDATWHEAGKYARLALAGNPTVMELLWLDQHEIATGLGQQLVGIRGAFLSARRVRDAYLGYATQQFRKLQARGDGTFSSDTRSRTAKHARHLARLLHQGAELNRCGVLVVRLPEAIAAQVTDFGERVAAGDTDAAARAIAAAEAAFDDDHTVLPDRPDETAVERWLLAVRAAHLPVPEGNPA